MGFFNTLWSVVSKPIALAGNAVGKAVGVDGLGDAIVGGVQADRAESLQQQAINKQTAATEYAANMAYKGAHEANELNYAATTQANAANRAIARETNMMNYVINQENNAANLALAREQNMWQEQQIAKQNAYNSPAHQVDLYRAAGLNPAALAGGNTWTPSGYATSANLANQQAAQMQQASPMQAPQFANEYADSANILMQGALQESTIRKDILKNAADTEFARAQAKFAYFNTHKGEVLLGAELDNLLKQNAKLAVDTKRIKKLLPHEKRNLVAQNLKLLFEADYIEQQYKTEKEKTHFQELVNHAQKVNNKILDATQEDLKKIPNAELKLKLASAFQAAARGQMDSWHTQYEKTHGHTVPDDAFMMLVSVLTGDKTFMSALKGIVTKTGKMADAFSKRIGDLVDAVSKLINDPIGALSDAMSDFDPFGIFSKLGLIEK